MFLPASARRRAGFEITATDPRRRKAVAMPSGRRNRDSFSSAHRRRACVVRGLVDPLCGCPSGAAAEAHAARASWRLGAAWRGGACRRARGREILPRRKTRLASGRPRAGTPSGRAARGGARAFGRMQPRGTHASTHRNAAHRRRRTPGRCASPLHTACLPAPRGRHRAGRRAARARGGAPPKPAGTRAGRRWSRGR